MRYRSFLAAMAAACTLPVAAMAQQPCYRFGTDRCVPFSIPALPTGAGAGVLPAGTAGNPLYVTGGTGGGGGTVAQGAAGGTPWPVAVSGAVAAGGQTAVVQVAPTVQVAAYAGGQVLGGKLALAGAARASGPGSGLVQQVRVTFAGGAQPAMDLVLFNSDPAASAVADRAALAVAASDLAKVVGVVHLSDCTLLGGSAPTFCQAEQLAKPFKIGAGTALYAALVVRGSVTPASTADVTVTLAMLQD